MAPQEVDGVTCEILELTGAPGDVWFTEPEEDDPESFGVPYAEVTEDNAIAWTKEKLGTDSVANIELTVGRNLEAMKTPAQQDGLPWAAVAEGDE